MEQKLKDIILTKTNFERQNVIDFDEALNMKTKLEIAHSISVEGDFIISYSYSLDAAVGENSQFDVFCNYAVQFTLSNYEDTVENNQFLDRFAHINAAAIIFPFIRELVYSITSKAGMLAVVIPSMNFIKEYEKKKGEETKLE